MVWVRKRDIEEEYRVGERTVDRRLKEIQDLIGTRYPARSIIRSPRVRIREDVIRDYMMHRAEIQAGTAPAFTGG